MDIYGWVVVVVVWSNEEGGLRVESLQRIKSQQYIDLRFVMYWSLCFIFYFCIDILVIKNVNRDKEVGVFFFSIKV